MSRVMIFYVILGLAALGVIGESVWVKPRFELDKDAQIELSNIPGKIDLKFVSDNIWTCSIVKGKLLIKNVKNYEYGWMEPRPNIKFQKDVPQGLPIVQGFEYYGPYGFSSNKSLAVFSLSSEKERYLPVAFVVIDTNDNKILGYKKVENYIQDFVWSPDSNMFIVLEYSPRRSLSIAGLISIFLTHPTDVHTFYLGIYDRRGKCLIHAKIASGLLDGRAQVFWRKEE
jgi:hypothetical protein